VEEIFNRRCLVIEVSNIEKLILAALHKQTCTIADISQKLDINRITASKYLAILEAKGLVVYRNVGKAKLYSIKEK
jgi:Mn-dependent DtxR family transcriptional regulator